MGGVLMFIDLPVEVSEYLKRLVSTAEVSDSASNDGSGNWSWIYFLIDHLLATQDNHSQSFATQNKLRNSP